MENKHRISHIRIYFFFNAPRHKTAPVNKQHRWILKQAPVSKQASGNEQAPVTVIFDTKDSKQYEYGKSFLHNQFATTRIGDKELGFWCTPVLPHEAALQKVVNIDKKASSIYVYDEITLNDIRAQYDEVFDDEAT